MAVLCFKLCPLQEKYVTEATVLVERKRARKHARFDSEVNLVLKVKLQQQNVRYIPRVDIYVNITHSLRKHLF
jgi:hypothetical protein